MSESITQNISVRPVPPEGRTADWWDTHERREPDDAKQRRALDVARLFLTNADWLVEHPEVPLPDGPQK